VRAEHRAPDPGGQAAGTLAVLDRGERNADDRAGDAGDLGGRRVVAGGDPEDDRDDRRGTGDRRDDAHRA
jgi:hypothetical protein